MYIAFCQVGVADRFQVTKEWAIAFEQFREGEEFQTGVNSLQSAFQQTTPAATRSQKANTSKSASTSKIAKRKVAVRTGASPKVSTI
jgi:hypothetical protein